MGLTVDFPKDDRPVSCGLRGCVGGEEPDAVVGFAGVLVRLVDLTAALDAVGGAECRVVVLDGVRVCGGRGFEAMGLSLTSGSGLTAIGSGTSGTSGFGSEAPLVVDSVGVGGSIVVSGGSS